MDRNYYRKTSITHEPEKYHYQQNSQSVPYSPVKVSQHQMNRADKFDQTAFNNKARTQKGSSQAQGQGHPTHKKVYSNYNNRESEDWAYYEKNARNFNQRNELPKSPQKPYIQRHDGGFQNDDHYAVNFESNRFGNNYQEELEVHYMEPTKEKSSKRAPVQNKANEGRYSSMNRLLEIRKREFDNDEYVYEGVGEYGSNQRENEREQSDDEWYQDRNQVYSNYEDEEGLTYENIVQNNTAAASYRSSNLKSHPDQNRHFPANPTFPSTTPKQGVLSNATSKKKLDLITLRSDYPDVPVFRPEDVQDYYNNDEDEYDEDDDQAPKKSYAQIHSDRIKNAKLAAKQSFELENKYMAPSVSNKNVKASPYDTQTKRKGEGWHTERDVTFENSYAVKEYPPTVPRKNRWEKLDITQTKEKSQPKKSERSPKHHPQDFNENAPPQSNYWPMSSPFKKKQLQENTSKYLNTVQQQSPPPPSSAKKSVKKQNMWVEEPDSQSLHSSQEAPSQFGILKSPPKRSVSTANLADDNSQELSRSKTFASSKSYLPQNRESYSPAGPRNTTQGGVSDSITISNQPSYNVSYVPTAATTPNSHVQLQLQLPIALNPTMQPNFQNMPPPQFVNPGYIYPSNFQNQPIAMNYPFTTNQPFYLNPQIYQNTPQMVFPNIPQPVYNNINPQPTASSNNSFVYFSNYGSIQDQQNTQSNLANMKLSQVIPSHQSLPRSEKSQSESTEDSQRKTLDKSIKNYIKDQEELLKKLDEDKKKLVERLKNPIVEQPQQHSVPTKREPVEEPPVKPEATPSKQKSSEKLKTSPKATIKTPIKAEETKKTVQKEPTASIPGTPKSKASEKEPPMKKERVSAWEAPSKQKSNKKEKKPVVAAELSLMDDNVAKVRSPSPRSPNFKIPSPKAPASIQQIVEPEKEQAGAWKMDFAVSEKTPVEDAFSIKKPTTLAEMFLKNKRDLAEKLDHQKDHSKPLDKENKPARTKEEILKQRKAMMEYKGPARAKSQMEERNEPRKEDLSPAPMGRGFGSSQNPFVDPSKAVKEPNPELLNRLAFGTRAKVTKEEMKALNHKNYELLPEVRKKKEEEKKKEEMRKRLEKAKELDEKIRGTMRRKTIKPFE